jgi:hypothetical protein
MSKKIAQILKTDMLADIDVPGLAQLLQRMGRKGDTVLAHITPKEARKLKREGGSGTKNPETGLPEFYDGEPDFETPNIDSSGDFVAQPQDSTPITEIQSLPDVATVQTPQVQDENLPFDVPAPQQGAFTPSVAPLPTGVPTASVQEIEALRQPETLGGFTPTTPEEKSFLDKLTPQQKLQLGLGLGTSLVTGLMGQRGVKQAQEAARKVSDIGAPYRQQGQEMIGAAQRGELTPQGQQTLQAARARLAQDVTRRGGVGGQQMETQLANLRNSLLEQQYNYGLKVASIGDQYAQRAIQTGLTQDAEMAKLMQGLAGSIGGMFGAQPRAQ